MKMLPHRALANSQSTAYRKLVSLSSSRKHPRASEGSRFSSSMKTSYWESFVRWSYSKLGHYVYPPKADICNCGVDFNYVLPQPELLTRDNIENGSEEWRMQLYGAALYWYAATTPRKGQAHGDLNMLRGKDVLEVACMRGGGARYLVDVVGPRSYVAIDNVQEHIDRCKRHTEHPSLQYLLADALSLHSHFSPSSFDAILCIQAVAKFADIPSFIRDASQLLRPGGYLIICDAFVRDKFKVVLDALQDAEFFLEDTTDLSRAVHAVGLCQIPTGISYLHMIARKQNVVAAHLGESAVE